MSWVKTKVTYLGSNIFQLALEDGQTLTQFNHEPGRLLEHLDWFGELAVKYQVDYSLLGIETGTGRAMFNMSKVPLEACSEIRSPEILGSERNSQKTQAISCQASRCRTKSNL
jgi:hypothetical protein